MRIISGKYKGRVLSGNNIKGTRPTMSRLKESVFSMIQTKVIDSVFLDLFAGTGSIGLEALSVGAKKVYFVDNGKIVFKYLKKNISDLNVQDYVEVSNLNYKDALKYYKQHNITFDIIYLDPPYLNNVINDCLKLIVDYNLLNNNGQVICEFTDEKITSIMELVKEKKYSDKIIRIYEKR